MAIRVGQLNVQYVADTADASDVRVTRVFAQAVIKTNTVSRAATNKIFDAADPLTGAFVEQAGPNFYRTAAHTIFVAPNGVDAENDPVYNRWVGHQLFGAAGDTTAEALYRAVSHTMLVSSSVPDEQRDVTHYLGFTDRHFEDTGHSLFRNADPVQISEAEIATCFNLIFDGSKANIVDRAYNIDLSLGWTATVAALYDLKIEQAIGLTNVLDTSSMSFTRSDDPAASSSGGGLLRQTISINVDNNDCRSEEFAPIIGSGTDPDYEDFLVDGPALVDVAAVTLTYPADGTVTNTLTLENPEFGNTHTNAFSRLDRPTRGGDRKIFSDKKWASWERLQMTITGIGCGNTPTVQNVIDFLNTTLGKEIRLADWEGRTWRGIIIAPETNVIEQQTGISLELVFEGEVTTLEVQYGEFDVIHGQDANGDDIEVTYEL